MAEQLILEVQHVYAGYRDGGIFSGKDSYQEVLHDIDFTVHQGEIVEADYRAQVLHMAERQAFQYDASGK